MIVRCWFNSHCTGNRRDLNAHLSSITISADKAPTRKRHTRANKWIFQSKQTSHKLELQGPGLEELSEWRGTCYSLLPPHSSQATSLRRIHSHVSRQQQQTCRRRGVLRTRTDGRTRTRTTRAQKRSQARSLTLRQKGRSGEQVWEDVSLPLLQSQHLLVWFNWNWKNWQHHKSQVG